MSTTFTCPSAPRTSTPCPWCKQAVEGGYDMDGKCDPWCDGTMSESEAPEVNIGHGNIGGILRLLGLPGGEDGDIYGSLEPSEVVGFRRSILRALNRDLSGLVVEPYEKAGGHAGTVVTRDDDGTPRIQRMGAAVICFGNTDEQTERRLTALDKLAQYAQEKGYGISWA